MSLLKRPRTPTAASMHFPAFLVSIAPYWPAADDVDILRGGEAWPEASSLDGLPAEGVWPGIASRVAIIEDIDDAIVITATGVRSWLGQPRQEREEPKGQRVHCPVMF